MINKKINSKIVASVFLALILCLGLFMSACNKDQNTPVEENNTNATEAPAANATPEPQAFGAFNVVIPDNGKYSIATENDIVKQAILNNIIKEKGISVDINVIPLDSNDYINQINSVLSSGQSVECLVDDYSMFDTYLGISGLCVSIDSLLTQYGQGLLNTISNDAWNAVTYKDMICAVPSQSLEETTAMYVRQDVLDLMGMGSIDSREMFDASLFAFSTIDGITPLAVNYSQALDYLSYLRHSPSNDFIYEYGSFKLREQHGYFNDFLEMLRSYYSKGFLPTDFFDVSEKDLTDLFTSGLAMMYITEYTNVADDYTTLLGNSDSARVELVTKPIHRRMAYVELSGETPVSEICLFTSYGQNHSALMVYLDWLLGDVENYATANLGILGTQLNFNNMAHEYQLLGDYEQKPDFYHALYGLGLHPGGLYASVVPINGDETVKKVKQLELDSYQHLSTAVVVNEGNYVLSPDTQSLYAYYRATMDEAIRKYVTGEITKAQYAQYEEECSGNADAVLAELNTMTNNGSRN